MLIPICSFIPSLWPIGFTTSISGHCCRNLNPISSGWWLTCQKSRIGKKAGPVGRAIIHSLTDVFWMAILEQIKHMIKTGFSMIYSWLYMMRFYWNVLWEWRCVPMVLLGDCLAFLRRPLVYDEQTVPGWNIFLRIGEPKGHDGPWHWVRIWGYGVAMNSNE